MSQARVEASVRCQATHVRDFMLLSAWTESTFFTMRNKDSLYCLLLLIRFFIWYTFKSQTKTAIIFGNTKNFRTTAHSFCRGGIPCLVSGDGKVFKKEDERF